MPRPALYKNVAQRIYNVEGFEIRINDTKGDELKPADTLPVMYPLSKGSYNNWRVSEWEKNKFAKYYSNYHVEVLDSQGNVVPRNTTLGRVRDTYREEE